MSAIAAATLIADLKHRRRELRKELARVRWWRRLVSARRDLSIAYLVEPGGLEVVDLNASWEALAADAPTSRELSAAIWPEPAGASPGSIEALDSLDARLGSYEARVGKNLDMVTAQMVQAMSEANRADAAQGRSHG